MFVNGNVIMECCEFYCPGRNVSIRLSRLYVEYIDWCKQNGVEDLLDKFTEGFLHVLGTDGFHTGGHAAENRKGARFSLHLATKHNDGSPHGEARYACAWGLATYYNIIERGAMYLTDAEKADLQYATVTCLSAYYWLRAEAVTFKRYRAWRPKPKQHQWVHLVEDFIIPTGLNPRWSWCYGDEDFIGRCKKMLVKCHRKVLAIRFTGHYMLLVALSIGDMRDGRM